MPDLTRNHPAVLAALNAETQRQRTRVDAYADDHIREMLAALTAALPHLTADAARAVVELTAERDAYREENTRFREQAARVKALADRLDAAAADDFDGVSGTSVSLVKYETAKAIRTALNGETHD